HQRQGLRATFRISPLHNQHSCDCPFIPPGTSQLNDNAAQQLAPDNIGGFSLQVTNVSRAALYECLLFGWEYDIMNCGSMPQPAIRVTKSLE
ncbi:MAG: hypothetical protein WCA63_01920, partial [Gallionella sp.]